MSELLTGLNVSVRFLQLRQDIQREIQQTKNAQVLNEYIRRNANKNCHRSVHFATTKSIEFLLFGRLLITRMQSFFLVFEDVKSE